MKKDISANLYQKCLIFCHNILLNVLHNISLTVLLPWQQNKISNILKSSWWRLKKSGLPWEQTFFYNCRCVFFRTISLPNFNGLHCKFSSQLYLYTWCKIGLSVWHHQSSHLHILRIFLTLISPELMQIFAKLMVNEILFVHGIVCDTSKKWRGKNLIIVSL